MDRSLLAEVVALRSIMSVWIAASLAPNKDWEGHLRNLEGYAQALIEGDKYVGGDESTHTFIKETASVRVSQLLSNIGRDLSNR